MSSFRPTPILGSRGTATQSSTIATVTPVVASAGNYIQGIAMKKQPPPTPATQLPLVLEKNEAGETLLYARDVTSGQRTLVAAVNTDGLFLSPNADTVESELKTQPLEQDGSKRLLMAIDGHLVLHQPTTVTSPIQALTYDNNTGRIVPVSSSKRYKDNIKPANLDTAAILDLVELVSYNDKRLLAKGEEVTEHGLIAEKFIDFPELLVRDKVTGEIESVNYHLITLVAIEQLRLAVNRIAALESKVDALTTTTQAQELK